MILEDKADTKKTGKVRVELRYQGFRTMERHSFVLRDKSQTDTVATAISVGAIGQGTLIVREYYHKLNIRLYHTFLFL